MDYARYFCGNFDGEVISQESYDMLRQSGRAYSSDTISYELIFDGKIHRFLIRS